MEFVTGRDPAFRGIYLTELSEPIQGERQFPHHPYRILEWSGPGSAIDRPRQWGDPITTRTVRNALVVAWMGPLQMTTAPAATTPPETTRRRRNSF